MKKAFAYLIAVGVAYLLGVLLITQFNIARITELGHAVGLVARLQTTIHDLGGMLTAYLPLIALALLIAFSFTGLLLLRFIPRSAALFALAGFFAILTLHLTINQVFGIVAVAPTRTIVGLGAQAMAGVIAGWVFYRLAWPKS